MIVREANDTDVPAIVRMGQRFARMVYGDKLADNPTQIAALAQQLMTSPDGALFVAEKGGAVVGMIGLLAYLHPMSGERIATEMAWWVEPEHRGIGMRLLKRAETWAVAQQALVFQMIAPTPDVERFYARVGFSKVETTYQRRLV